MSEKILNRRNQETKKEFNKRVLKEERQLNAESIEDKGDEVIITYFESLI